MITKFKLALLLFLTTFYLNGLGQNFNQKDYDTVYIMDYYYKGPPGIDYFGSTIVFLPNGDSVVLKTKSIQIMPVDFDQYAMIRIIIPKDSSVTFSVRFSAKKRKMVFQHTERITLKRTQTVPSIYYGRIMIEECGKNNTGNCPIRIRNSDNLSKAFLRNILERNIEKGVTHIYDYSTGTLLENPVYYNR